jgi:hypothetical protein
MKQQSKFESRMIITTTGCLPSSSSSSSSSSPSGETGSVMMYNLDIGVDDGWMLGGERQRSNEFESGVGYAGVDDRCRGRIKIRVSEDGDHNQRLCDDHMYYNRDIGADAGEAKE